jgi:hypothetical protein
MREIGGRNAPAPVFFWQRGSDGRSFGQAATATTTGADAD